MRRVLFPMLLGVALAAAIACGGDGQTPTPTATPTVTATPTSTPITDVRQLDFADPALLGPLIDHFSGGEVEAERIEYLDLTGDGVDEAFVVVASGGTAGDLGAALVTVEAGAARILGYVDAGGRVELRFPEAGGGVVVSQAGVYETGDPLCCPTNLRERVYRWNGDEFEPLSDQVIPNPNVD